MEQKNVVVSYEQAIQYATKHDTLPLLDEFKKRQVTSLPYSVLVELGYIEKVLVGKASHKAYKDTYKLIKHCSATKDSEKHIELLEFGEQYIHS